MGWGNNNNSRSRSRRSRSPPTTRQRDRPPDEHARSRSRSSSRDRRRHSRRRHSRSRSPGRWQPDRSRSPDCGHNTHRHSRSRSRDRGRRHYSRSRSPPYSRRSRSPPLRHHHAPPWQPGPGAEVPPWHQQAHPHPHGAEVPPWHHHSDGAPLLPPAPHHHREPRDRHWDRSRSRGGGGSDTDRDWSEGLDDGRGGRRGAAGQQEGGPGGCEVATASVFIKGLPFDADESDIHAAFSNFPNIQSVKVLRDRSTGRSKGAAFMDFASTADAKVLMECEARYTMVIGGQPLFLDYSSGPPAGSSGGQGGQGGAAALDWICDMCSSVNFARRLECYHCSTARPANPRRVTADLSEPSNILKVSGLEPQTGEEELYRALSAVVPSIMDLRVIKDKYTGAPRGFAFVELASVAAAGSLMVSCQGMMLSGQATPLKICYAKAKEKLMGSAATMGGAPGDRQQQHQGLAEAGYDGDAAAGAAAAGEHAAEAQAYSGPMGWKPKEFNPHAAAASDDQQQQQGPTAAAAASSGEPSAAAGTDGGAAAAAAAPGPGPSSEAAAASSAAAAAAGVDAATIQALTQAGFEYQASSGYWWDAKSGYFYDAKTQLYYHHSTNQWYQYNPDTGQYTAVGGEQQQQQEGGGQQGQQQPQQQASAAAGAAGQVQQQQQQQQQQKQASAADKRRRAVIGSAPQYNPEGLLAAAALAEERAAEERRVAAAKAARERQQHQQNKHGTKQQAPPLMQGKPGIGMLPGTTGTASAPAAGQVVAQGSVQGVVYKSKWSQQRAQTQQQTTQ